MSIVYADPDQQLRDEIREVGRLEMREQRADEARDTETYRPSRLALLEARVVRAGDEAVVLTQELQAWAWEVKHADDSGEQWMRAIESALSQIRESLVYLRKYTGVA